MKYRIIVENEFVNPIHKNKKDIIEADNDEQAKELASQLYTSDTTLEVRKIIPLVCYHKNSNGKICGYKWNYTGNRTKCATCPDCHKQVYIDQNKRMVK